MIVFPYARVMPSRSGGPAHRIQIMSLDDTPSCSCESGTARGYCWALIDTLVELVSAANSDDDHDVAKEDRS